MLADGAYRRRGPYFTDTTGNMGRSAMLAIGRVLVVVTSEATQTEERSQFELFGVEFASLQVLACKGNNHFRADLEPVAGEIVYVDATGICSADPASRKYLRLRRPIWPLDPLPA